jgi:hypothetical protein
VERIEARLAAVRGAVGPASVRGGAFAWRAEDILREGAPAARDPLLALLRYLRAFDFTELENITQARPRHRRARVGRAGADGRGTGARRWRTGSGGWSRSCEPFATISAMPPRFAITPASRGARAPRGAGASAHFHFCSSPRGEQKSKVDSLRLRGVAGAPQTHARLAEEASMARKRLEAGRGAREGARAADVQRTAQAAEFAFGTLEDFTRAEARIQAPPRPAPASPKAGGRRLRPSLRTNRTRRVPHSVLIGHAASLTPY